ncbi:zinc ABC transporter substrate-binding protein [Parasulfuritortus cantonensis]|uniref:Zinc ABC transporter substrate-binding protein n=1 Tax=Parasulfuritortus cantonensis TaxID=2528202 RepID=A0A4R1BEJ4_9PROT|nr:zinc ABC transporter substrate-binding protein [Parasulfuritortus cantonensis]TCJ15503.1 zinc ABC transporter substrate-binding protein [Parasulfuritortus cantonensis]
MLQRILLLACLLCGQTAHAALNVLACEPEWAALTSELAGDHANVSSATTARQDPHHIQARPSLIAKARNADLLVCTGADLEIGWLPLLQREAGNPRIQTGQPGLFEAARYVALLEKPTSLSRAQGDVHADGNPHIQTDPRNLLKVADALAARLAELDPGQAAYYAGRNRSFQTRMNKAIAGWEKAAAGLRGLPVVVHHKSWSYLAAWLGLNVVADLEPKPGIDPSAAYLAQVLERLKTTPARMILRTAYQSDKPSAWLAERAGIPAIELPFTVGGSAGATDLFSLFDDTIAKLVAAAR